MHSSTSAETCLKPLSILEEAINNTSAGDLLLFFIIQQKQQMDTIENETGFVQWANDDKSAYFWHDTKNVYRVGTNTPKDVNGRPQGRWESSVDHWNQYAVRLSRAGIKK